MTQQIDCNGKVPRPTLKPYPNFNAKSDVETLKKAMDGLGTEEDLIVEVLGRRTASQRIAIAEAYKSSYGVDLRKELASELSGDFAELVDLMFYNQAELKAQICYKAIRGAGTDELALIEVICTSTRQELTELKHEYAKVVQQHGKQASLDTLEDHIMADTTGYFEKILVALLAAQRPEPTEEQIKKMMSNGIETFIDKKAAMADAQALYNAGEKIMGTDEAVFIKILCNTSPWQLQAISNEYEKLSKMRLLEAIASETSGDFKRALTITLLSNINKAMAFAELLEKALAGLGTNDDELMRIIVWRSEIDLEDIKNAYLTRFNRSLVDDVKDDVSGDYENLLVLLLGAQ